MIKNKSLILSVALVLVLFSTIGLSACGGSSPTTTHPITTTNPPITTTIPPTTTTVPPTTTTPPTTTVPPTTTSGSGAAIYNSPSANCTFCHGANRQGVTLGTTVLGPPIPASLQYAYLVASDWVAWMNPSEFSFRESIKTFVSRPDPLFT